MLLSSNISQILVVTIQRELTVAVGSQVVSRRKSTAAGVCTRYLCGSLLDARKTRGYNGESGLGNAMYGNGEPSRQDSGECK